MNNKPVLEVYAQNDYVGEYLIGIVEDEEFGRTLCMRVSREANVSTVMCWQVQAVQVLLNQLDVSFFVIDMMLGNTLRGLEVIENIRKSGKKTFIIAISGHNNVETQAIDAGANDFIDKGKGPDYAVTTINNRFKEWRDNNFSYLETRTEVLPCIVVSIDNDHTIVEMMIGQKTVTRTFPTSRLDAVGAARSGAELNFILTWQGSRVTSHFSPVHTKESNAWRDDVNKEIEEFKDDNE